LTREAIGMVCSGGPPRRLCIGVKLEANVAGDRLSALLRWFSQRRSGRGDDSALTPASREAIPSRFPTKTANCDSTN